MEKETAKKREKRDFNLKENLDNVKVFMEREKVETGGEIKKVSASIITANMGWLLKDTSRLQDYNDIIDAMLQDATDRTKEGREQEKQAVIALVKRLDDEFLGGAVTQAIEKFNLSEVEIERLNKRLYNAGSLFKTLLDGKRPVNEIMEDEKEVVNA